VPVKFTSEDARALKDAPTYIKCRGCDAKIEIPQGMNPILRRDEFCRGCQPEFALGRHLRRTQGLKKRPAAERVREIVGVETHEKLVEVAAAEAAEAEAILAAYDAERDDVNAPTVERKETA
jgi:hypothetical protein